MRKYHPQEQPTLGSSIVGLGTRLIAGVIESVDTENYTCKVTLSDLGGVRTVTLNPGVIHNKDWVRHVPSPGTPVLLSYRPQGILEIVSYYDNYSVVNVEDYREGKSLYRTLVEGESDSMSTGRSGHWQTDQGRYFLHAGTVFFELNKEDHEINAEAGRISIESPQVDGLTRVSFGAVKRKVGKSTVICTSDGKPFSEGGIELRAIEVSVASDPSTSESSDLPKQGPKLFDLRAGNVVDDSGVEEQDPDTSGNLRLRLRVHNGENTFFVDLRADENGNFVLTLPPTATVGLVTKLLGGNLQLVVENGDVVAAAKNVAVTTKESVSVQAAEDLFLTSGNRSFLTSGSSTYIISDSEVGISSNSVSIGADVDLKVSSAKSSTLSSDLVSTIEGKARAVVSSPDVRLGDDSASLRILLESFLPIFMAHTHEGVKAGNEVSGPVSGSSPEGVLTTKTKAT